ncbi:MAG: FHA domain-containing protein [Thermoleophilia bacterium]|nr:FHA domain-containing protein [Thermoleophilia bacterium]
MEAVLLGLKAAFLVLLYLFIWRVVRSAARELRVPQESFVLAPAQARAAGLASEAPRERSRLVVVSSPSLEPGRALEVAPVPLTIGRAADNGAALDGDEYASAHHARVESTRDGVWLVDLGSTNGTFVNGERMNGRRRLRDGDAVRIGETELRFET